MNLKEFVERLEQLDDNQFKIGLGLTKTQFEELFIKFQGSKLGDTTRKITDDREKLYAILIYVNFFIYLDDPHDKDFKPKLFGQLILNSGPNSNRDGAKFIAKVPPRLEGALKSSNIVLGAVPESRKQKVPTSLDEILGYIHTKMVLPNGNEAEAGTGAIQAPRIPTIKKENNHHVLKQEITERTPTPGFIVNITAYVPSDTDTSSSEDSDDGEGFEFNEEEFDTPPFHILEDQRGSLETKETELVITPGEDFRQYQSKVVKPLLSMLKTEGFADEKDNREDKAQKHLSVSFGLNRPKSLSTGKNKVLTRELTAEVQTDIPHARFGLFWRFPWRRRHNVSMETRGKGPVTYEEVQSYYRQLKKRDPEAARDFRRSEENEVSRNRMVPYRELRENTKNHSNTKMLVIDMRKRNPGADAYMSFVDSDTRHFKTDEKGLFQGYTNLYYQFKAPDVMSTGYEYFSKHLPMLQLACLLDRRVREATAFYIPFGVYYPEPNFIVKIIEGDDTDNTIKESFFELTPGGRVKQDNNYISPQESPTLLEKVAKRPNVNFPHFALFASQNPIQIAAPKRAENNGSGGALTFNAKIEKNGKYAAWSESDITNITQNISQTHVNGRDWATNLFHALECSKAVKIGSVTIINGGTIRMMAISLLSRLYNKYDPITLSKLQPRPANMSYQAHLQRVLENYDTARMDTSIPTTSRDTYQNVKERTAWGIIDGLSDTRGLKEMLGRLLVGADIENIEKAAIGAGSVIRNTLLEFLQFPPTRLPPMAPKVRRGQLN